MFKAGVGYLTALPCTQAHIAQALAGGVVAMYNLDTLLPAPKIVHYALAGKAVDVFCRGQVDAMKPDEATLMSMAYGTLGAVVLGCIKGGSFSALM